MRIMTDIARPPRQEQRRANAQMSGDEDSDGVRRREARLRRVAASLGLALRKSRARDCRRMDYGCYRIVNVERDYTVAGAFPYGYSLDLDAVEDVLGELLAQQEDREIQKEWLARHGSGGEADSKWRRR
jgi:hypothetical protein